MSATNPIRRARAIPAAAMMAWLVISMTACAATTVPARVMIEFGVATDGASPAWRSRLETRSGAVVRHATSVSSQRHVYELRCPPRDAGCDTAIRKLREDPDIMGVVPDTLRAAHPVSP